MRSAATDRDRWSASSVLTIAMCCAMGLVSGTAYAFGGYERDLKFAIALSQTEVQALGIVIDVAMGGTQMLSGWIVDNFSSCVGAGVASLLVGAGYMTVALALWDTGDADAGAGAGAGVGADAHAGTGAGSEGSGTGGTVPLLGFGLFAVGFGSGLGFVSALRAAVRHALYPQSQRGRVVALVMSGFGLSAALLTLSKPTGLADAGPALGSARSAEGGGAGSAGGAPGILGARRASARRQLAHFFAAWGVVLACVYGAGSFVLRAAARRALAAHNVRGADESTEQGILLTARAGASAGNGDDAGADADADALAQELGPEFPAPDGAIAAPRGNEHTEQGVSAPLPLVQLLPRLLRDPGFRLLFATFFLGTGCGLLVINNVGTLVESSYGQPGESGGKGSQGLGSGGSEGDAGSGGGGAPSHGEILTRQLVVLLSVSNCAGRICFGTLSDLLPCRRGLVVALALALMSTAHIQAAAAYGVGSDPQATLFVLVCGAGLAYGGCWALMSVIVSETFSAENFGFIFGFCAMATAMATTLFNRISAALYEDAASGTKSATCLGRACYSGTLAFSACAACLGVGCALLLVKYTRFARAQASHGRAVSIARRTNASVAGSGRQKFAQL